MDILGSENNPIFFNSHDIFLYNKTLKIFDEMGVTYVGTNDLTKSEDLRDLNVFDEMLKFFHANQKTGRNELCPCGSEKKFKKCCLHKVCNECGAIHFDDELKHNSSFA